MKKITHIIAFALSFMILCDVFGLAPAVQAARQSRRNGNVVVVIDPGHGGVGENNNDGAIYHGMLEKNLNLATAAVMKQTLDQFEGITTYLTRTTDTEVSLPARAQYAAALNADFLVSLHFNASGAHHVYGSEIWIPSQGNLYARGYSFASVATEELGALGLYQRGIKTRVGSKGDYYGIIRNCALFGIPSVIIEHCHMDHGVDVSYLRSTDSLMKLGYADAIAVAKYFGLRSESLGLDFSGYRTVSVKAPKNAVAQDTTPPEVCTAVKTSYDPASRTMVLNCTAQDAQSPVIYYAASFDGGLTYTTLLPWNRALRSADITIQVPQNATHVIFRAYNQYDKYTDALPVPVY